MQYGSPTSTYSAKLEANGRIVIPARVREALGLVAGAELSLTVEGDALLVRSKRATVKRVRERLRAQLPPDGAAGTSGVDAFLAERHEDDTRRELRLDQLLHRRSAP